MHSAVCVRARVLVSPPPPTHTHTHIYELPFRQASATPAVVEEPVKVPSPAKSKLPEAKENEWEIAKPAKSGNSGNKKKTLKPAAAAVAAAAAPVPGMGGGSNDAAANTAPAVKGRVEVTTKKLGVIIGPGGETMKKLQEATGTRINTPPKGEQAGLVTIVTVEGSAEGVAACSRAIRDLAEKGYSTITHPNFNEGSVQMFPMYVSTLPTPRLLAQPTHTRTHTLDWLIDCETTGED
jgi:hypothetical protein